MTASVLYHTVRLADVFSVENRPAVYLFLINNSKLIKMWKDQVETWKNMQN